MFALCLLLLAAVLSFGFPVKGYYRIAVIADPHLPWSPFNGILASGSAQAVEKKEKILAELAQDQDVDEVVVVGDITATSGTEQEYAFAKDFFSKVGHPVVILAGNHDYLYKDYPGNGPLRRGSAEDQTRKLARFRSFFGDAGFQGEMDLDQYHLEFLSPDKTLPAATVELSQSALAWWKADLLKNARKPTLVFFHAPLWGTLAKSDKHRRDDHDYAQPKQEIDAILRASPQVMLWVSGHTHTKVTNPSFDNPDNLYDRQVLDVYNEALAFPQNYNGTSLFLYPDHIEVRTWDYQTGQWMTSLDRRVELPHP